MECRPHLHLVSLENDPTELVLNEQRFVSVRRLCILLPRDTSSLRVHTSHTGRGSSAANGHVQERGGSLRFSTEAALTDAVRLQLLTDDNDEEKAVYALLLNEVVSCPFSGECQRLTDAPAV